MAGKRKRNNFELHVTSQKHAALMLSIDMRGKKLNNNDLRRHVFIEGHSSIQISRVQFKDFIMPSQTVVGVYHY